MLRDVKGPWNYPRFRPSACTSGCVLWAVGLGFSTLRVKSSQIVLLLIRSPFGATGSFECMHEMQSGMCSRSRLACLKGGGRHCFKSLPPQQRK